MKGTQVLSGGKIAQRARTHTRTNSMYVRIIMLSGKPERTSLRSSFSTNPLMRSNITMS